MFSFKYLFFLNDIVKKLKQGSILVDSIFNAFSEISYNKTINTENLKPSCEQ